METEASVAFSPAPKEALLLDWTAAVQEICLRQWPSGSTYASGESKSRSGEQRSSMLTSAAPTSSREPIALSTAIVHCAEDGRCSKLIGSELNSPDQPLVPFCCFQANSTPKAGSPI